MRINKNLLAFAFLFASCALNEPIVQSQSSANTNSKEIALTNQNAKNQNSSDENM